MSGSNDSDATWSPGTHTFSQGDHGLPFLEPLSTFVNVPADDSFSENVDAQDPYSVNTGFDTYSAWGSQTQPVHIYVPTNGHVTAMACADPSAHFAQPLAFVGSGHNFSGNPYAIMERYGPDSAYSNTVGAPSANNVSYPSLTFGTNGVLAVDARSVPVPRENTPLSVGDAPHASLTHVRRHSPSLGRNEKREKTDYKSSHGKRVRDNDSNEKPKKKTSRIAPKPPAIDLDKRAESSDESKEDEKITENEFRTDPAYKNLMQDVDGNFHCPFKDDPAGCGHGVATRRCEANRWLDSHLKPFRCDAKGCENKPFSSAATLSRHKKEMHSHIKYFCTYQGCNRSEQEHGFDRQYNRDDHMKRTHNWKKEDEAVEELQSDEPQNKRARVHSNEPASDNAKAKRPELASELKQQIQCLREEWVATVDSLHKLTHLVKGSLDDAAHEQIFAMTDQLKTLHRKARSINEKRELARIQNTF